jgi:multicomponent Na+:H+ antiporter subunit F
MIFDNYIIYFILPVLSISMIMILIRLIKGPSLIDKVIALDLLVIVGIAAFSAYAILYNKSMIVDISLILALIAFLSTVAFAYYYEKKDIETDEDSDIDSSDD